MLGGQLSHAEEEEAQSELQDLAREVTGAPEEQAVELPEAPSDALKPEERWPEREETRLQSNDGTELSLPA